MPNIAIVYFSQGGTTAQVAEQIAAGLKAKQCQVDLINLMDGTLIDVTKYDLLGIGSPTYYFRPPSIVMDYIESLPSLNGKKFFVFLVNGTYSFDASDRIRRALIQKGAQELGYFSCYGANYFLGYLQRGYLFSLKHPTEKELTQAVTFGERIVDNITAMKGDQPTNDKPAPFIYRLERFLTNRWMIEQIYSRLFYVSKKKCNSCGLCVKLCPTHNIKENNNGLPSWGRSCLLCLTCELKCPAGAITSAVSWPIFLPFMSYNVWEASKDSSIDFVRVKHHNGQVIPA